MKSAVLRQRAEDDIENAFVHYLDQAGNRVATQYIEAIDIAIHHLEQFPKTGSPRYGELFNTPGLRSWLLNRFPYTLFYIERDDHLDVIRLLHQHSDIPEQLQED
jgi:toxin ParE1/3/4